MRKTLFLTLLLGLGFAAAAWAASSRNTNVTVDSKDLNGMLDDRREDDERFSVPIDESTELGFTDNGDPAVSRRF
ncbi:MAG TPA: hypothetical protein VL404_03890 [Candidatus Eisenbacteria bacterium]|jgi:hypothetical protein|nr:hypothetical protein [Candidatus Eisenbacteria bacterium]